MKLDLPNNDIKKYLISQYKITLGYIPTENRLMFVWFGYKLAKIKHTKIKCMTKK